MVTENNQGPQKGVYALVSGAGNVVQKDGLETVVLIERELPSANKGMFKSTIYGKLTAIVLILGPDNRWHITGPVSQIKKDEIIRVAEGLRLLAGETSV